MHTPKILTIFGTRPETIKLAPVLLELSQYTGQLDSRICITAQHREMLDDMLTLFGINPHIDLNAMNANQSLSDLSARLIPLLDTVIKQEHPDLVLVQGDTTSAMLTALVSYYNKVPVGHIEAGLRTLDRYHPFPEEINRRMISALSMLHFAPTKRAVQALNREGFDQNSIFYTGNTIVDALKLIQKRFLQGDLPPMPIPLVSEKRMILVTAHRRENFGEPLQDICKALRTIAGLFRDCEILFPVHPNPNVKGVVHDMLSDIPNIRLLPPLSYLDFIYLLSKCALVLTDSGGVQEEAPTFSKPVLVLRGVTERPELIESGLGEVVGTEPDRIVKKVKALLEGWHVDSKIPHCQNPFGDGKASERICHIIHDFLLSKITDMDHMIPALSVTK